VGENPNHGYTNFDNFMWSMLTTFQLITLDYWENVYNMVGAIKFLPDEQWTNFVFLLGAGHLWSYERLILHGGGLLWLVLPDQPDAGRSGAELRGGGGDHERGEYSAHFSIALPTF